MCFVIDKTAVAPETRVAYKVVLLAKGSGAVHSYYRGYKWCTGVHELSAYARARTRATIRRNKEQAHQGFYVYMTLAAARRAIRSLRFHADGKACVILKVCVDKKDWLYSNDLGGAVAVLPVATYAKVTVPEEQPYIEWY